MSERDSTSSEADDDVIRHDSGQESEDQQIKPVCSARTRLYGKNPPISSLVEDAAIITPLVKALDSLDLQYQALDVLTSVVFGSCEHTATIINSEAISKLISFLICEDDLEDWQIKLAERAILILGNIALHGPAARHAVLSRGAVRAMLPHMRTDTPVRRLRTFVRAYSNLCSYDDEDDVTIIQLVSPALPYIHDILNIEHEDTLDPDDKEAPFIACDVIVDACTALSNIMLGPDECIEAVQLVPGLTARLVGLLGHEGAAVREAALSAVGNMLAGTDVQVHRCLDANCLDHIIPFLRCNDFSLVKQAAHATENILVGTRMPMKQAVWAISNILAGTVFQIQQALDKDVLTLLRNILAQGKPECQMQAVSAITNLCNNGSTTQCEQLVLSGALQPYCALLVAEDLAVSGEVLDGLDALMQAAERDGNVKSLSYMLDELDVLDHVQLLLKRVTDEIHFSKLVDMSGKLRRHAREERLIVFDDEQFSVEKIVQGLGSQDIETRTRAFRAAYCMLSEQNPPVNALLEAGIMTPLVEGLDIDASSTIKHVATWTLSKFTAGSSIQRKAVVISGAIPKLLALLVCEKEIAQLAACSLGNLALHGPAVKFVLAVYFNTGSTLTVLRTYMKSYNHLCSQTHETKEKLQRVLEPLPFVSVLLDFGDREIIADVCQACANLMPGPDSHGLEPIQAPGLTVRLVVLLRHEDSHVREPALMAVANILAGTDAQADVCLDAGCLEHIVSFLQCKTPSLVLHAARAARNIFRRSPCYIEQALEKDILTPLRNVLAGGEAMCQLEAAVAITALCLTGSAAQLTQLMRSGALQPYCALLTEDLTAAECVLDGLDVLLHAAENDDKSIKPLCQELDEIGVLEKLEKLQEQEIDKELRLKAVKVSATVLRQARDEHVVIEDGYLFPLPKIVQGMKSEDLPTLQRAVRAAKSMLDRRDPPREAMVKAGAVPPLVAVLDRDDCANLRQIVTIALCNITTMTHENRVAVLNSGGVPKLVAIVAQGGQDAEPAAWTLGNLCLNALKTRDLVLSHGAVGAMLPHMRKDAPRGLLRSCVATYMNLCRKIIEPSIFEFVSPALPYIAELLDIEDHSILYFACAALSNLTHILLDRIDPVQEVAGLTERLVALIGHEAANVQEAALATVTSMLTGTNAQCERCFDAGCLERIVPLLYSSNPALLDRAVRAIGNVLAGTPAHVQLALEKGALIPLLNTFEDAEPNSHLQYNALRSLSNITARGTNEQKMIVVNCGIIPKLVSLIPEREATAEQAVRALGYMSVVGPQTRDLVLSHGAMLAMLPYMRSDTPSNLLSLCLRAYKFLCSHEDDDPTEKLERLSPALPYISMLLKEGVEDELALEHLCWALVGLTRTHEGIEAVQSTPGLTTRLVELLKHKEVKVKSTAVIAVMVMLSGTDAQVDRCFDASCVDYVISYMECKDPSLMEAAVKATRDTLGPELPWIQQALERSLTSLMTMLACSSEDQQRIVKGVRNLCCRATDEQRTRLVSRGALQLCGALLATRDKRRVGAALEALDDMLQVAVDESNLEQFCQQLVDMGVPEQLTLLQEHEDEEMNEKARRLLHTYFSEDNREQPVVIMDLQ